jgi:hypothetical protein
VTETVVAIHSLLESTESTGARLKGRARGALICALGGSAWMFWAAVFASTARTASLVLVSLMMILIGGWAVSRVRAARRYVDSAADRERWASIAPQFWIDTAAEWVLGAGCGRHIGALRALLGNPPIPWSHYRITLSPSCKSIQGTSLLHYGNNYDFVCSLRFSLPKVAFAT